MLPTKQLTNWFQIDVETLYCLFFFSFRKSIDKIYGYNVCGVIYTFFKQVSVMLENQSSDIFETIEGLRVSRVHTTYKNRLRYIDEPCTPCSSLCVTSCQHVVQRVLRSQLQCAGDVRADRVET